MIFVKEGKVGQNAKIRVVQVGNRFAIAEIVDGASSSAPSNTTATTTAATNQEPT